LVYNHPDANNHENEYRYCNGNTDSLFTGGIITAFRDEEEQSKSEQETAGKQSYCLNQIQNVVIHGFEFDLQKQKNVRNNQSGCDL
jgi:hypothetical protein